MKIITKKLNYVLNINKDKSIIIDFNTTGQNYRYSYLYLFTYIYYNKDSYYLTSYFCERLFDEKKMLLELINILVKYKIIMVSNYENILFINNKFKFYNIDYNIDKKSIYFLAKNNISKTNTTNMYFEYIAKNDSDIYISIVCNSKNYMFNIIQSIINTKNIEVNNILDMYIKNNILFITLDKKTNTHNIKYAYNSWSIYKDSNYIIEIKIFNTTLKYFFSDYKNYFYFPDLDEAMHKSIAKYSTYKKIKANKANCYIKKTGLFIEVFNEYKNSFRDNYDDKNKYMLLPKDINDLDLNKDINDFLEKYKGAI